MERAESRASYSSPRCICSTPTTSGSRHRPFSSRYPDSSRISLRVPNSLAVSMNPETASRMLRRASLSVSPQLEISSSGTCATKARPSLKIRTVNCRFSIRFLCAILSQPAFQRNSGFANDIFLFDDLINTSFHQSTAVSCSNFPDLKRAGLITVTSSMTFVVPDVIKSATIFPVAGACITPCPLKPLAA